jgi:hypothetical protein
MIKYSGCKGCFGYSGDMDNSCNGRNNKDSECPCSDCLIKSMCTNECQAYSEFIDKVYKRETDEFLRGEKPWIGVSNGTRNVVLRQM